MSDIELTPQAEKRIHKNSIRNSLRYFILQELDVKKVMEASVEDITLELLKNFPTATGAEIGSARQVAKWIKSDSNRVYITDNVDGKLEQTVNLPLLKQVLNMSDEDLENVIENNITTGPDHTANTSIGDSGNEPEKGTAGSTSPEVPANPQQ